MIDNVRLGEGGGRVSMVMTRVDDGGVTLALIMLSRDANKSEGPTFHDEVLRALDGP